MRSVFRLSTLAVLACAGFLCAAASPQLSSGAIYYCNQYVAAHSVCPDYINEVGGNHNQAYASHGNGIPVCEKATIRYQAANVSRRCGGSPVDSQCDLTYYDPSTEFSTYTGNNDIYYVFMVGKVYSGYLCA